MSDTPTFQLSGGTRIRGAVADAIDAQIARLRAHPGCRVVGIVELERYQINAPDDADTEPVVLLRPSALELAKGGDQEAQLRLAMQALHMHRTAGGTLTEDSQVELSQQTLDQLPDLVSAFESARLRAAFEYVEAQLRGLAANNRHNDGDLRRELKALAKKVTAALSGEQLSIDGTGTLPAKKAPLPAKNDPLDVSGIPDTDATPVGTPV